MGGHLWVAPRPHCVTEALELRFSIRFSNIRGPGVIGWLSLGIPYYVTEAL